MKGHRIRNNNPTMLLLCFLAGLFILSGAGSAAYGQNGAGRVIAGSAQGSQNMPNRPTNRPPNRNSNRNIHIDMPQTPSANKPMFGPIRPRLKPRSSSRNDKIFIGPANRLPKPPPPPPEPPSPKELKDMESLADSGEQGENGQLGPSDTRQARRVGDIARMNTEDETLTPDFNELNSNNKNIRTARVQVHLKEGQDDKQSLLSWQMNPLEYPVFIKKVNALEQAMLSDVPVTASGTAYSRLTVELVHKNGQNFAPVSIYQNRVFLPDEDRPRQDSGRDLETWVMGTAKRHNQREIISTLIDVMSYEDCKMLGHTLVDGAPRQCILPDGTTYIDIDEKITPKAREITNFEICLKRGHPIVDTFPRQCVAPGGRIYVAPPQL